MNDLESTNSENITDPVVQSKRSERMAWDVAVGESIRAEAYARGYAARSREAAYARADRDAAFVNSVIAADRARRASLGFWTLLGVFVIAMAVGLFWYMSRPEPTVATTTTTVVSREMPAARPRITPAPAVQTPVRTIPVPVPAAPRVIERRVPVYVPVPVPAAAPTNSAVNPTPAPEAASPADTDTQTQPRDDAGSDTDAGSS